MALAKSQAYQDAADAPATLRAYATDLANYKAWCDRHRFVAMPATPEVVGAYLAAAGEGYAMPTLRRRVAAIARACGVAGHPLDTKHPAIRETLRGIGRKHGSPSRRAAAITTTRSGSCARHANWSRRRPRSGTVAARLRRRFSPIRARGAGRRTRDLDTQRVEAADRAFKDGRAGGRRRDRHSPWPSRRHLPSRRPEDLAGAVQIQLARCSARSTVEGQSNAPG